MRMKNASRFAAVVLGAVANGGLSGALAFKFPLPPRTRLFRGISHKNENRPGAVENLSNTTSSRSWKIKRVRVDA
jgi:hypothetical protein